MDNKNIFYISGGVLFLIFFTFLFFLSPPSDFPVGTILKIESGESLRSVSLQLKEEHIIRSRTVFEAFIIIFGREKGVVATDYYFENKLSVYEIAKRISRGEHHIAPVVVTIPEGYDVTQIADTFSSKLPNFNKDKFMPDAKLKEGYLFPDTYFFLRIDNEQDVLKIISANFDKKIAPFLSSISSSGKTEKEVIIMASIIEREAKGNADREAISGILWRRIRIGIPLQVDAAPETYKAKGLPKSPICNPGVEAIKAAIDTQSSPYLYYLHDKNGNIHYAKTFAEHQANIAKYLTK
jgi:UPF0755 protein